MSDDQKLADEWAAALGDQNMSEDASETPLEEFEEGATSSGKAPLSAEERKKLDSILDIPVTITMEVGHAKISIRNLLQLNEMPDV